MMIDKNTKIKIDGIPEGYTVRRNSGNFSEFRKQGQNYHDSEEIRIEAPEKGLKSELINGEWFWVCGCSHCLGTEEDWCYWVCDEHNVCVTCGIHRSKLKEAPWGHQKGFRCKDCQDRINRENLIEALEKMEEKKYDECDYHAMDEVKCPHCDLEYQDIHESTKTTCYRCGGEFDIEIEYNPSISTSIIGERVTLESIKKIKND
jgi:hypothetical protein